VSEGRRAAITRGTPHQDCSERPGVDRRAAWEEGVAANRAEGSKLAERESTLGPVPAFNSNNGCGLGTERGDRDNFCKVQGGRQFVD